MTRILRSKTSVVFLAVLLLVAVLLAFVDRPNVLWDPPQPERGIPNELYFEDYDILHVYSLRSDWVKTAIFPYKDAPQEYPQLGLLFISLPRLVSENPQEYLAWYLVLVLATFVGAGVLLYAIIRALGLPRSRVLLILLPSFLYFTISRFDIFAVFLVLASLFFLVKKKNNLALIFLALGFLCKWYAVFLVPIYLAFIANKGVLREKIRTALAWFLSIIGGVTLVTIIFAGVNALFPYAFHAQRTVEGGGVAWLVGEILFFLLPALPQGGTLTVIAQLFFGLQFLPLLYGIFSFSSLKSKLQSIHHVLRMSTVFILIFVMFGKLYSPQWEMWWIPFAVLGAERKRELWCIVLVDVLNYVQYPLLFWYAGPYSYIYDLSVLIRTALTLLILYWYARPFFSHQKNQDDIALA